MTFIHTLRYSASLRGWLLAVTLLAVPLLASGGLPERITLYTGQSEVISVEGAIRVTVGDTSLVSATMLKTGDVVLIAEGTGETNILVWFEDGTLESTQIVIVEEDGLRQVDEVRALLEGISGIEVKILGRRIVVDGQIATRDLERVKLIQQRYGDILILAREVTAFEQKMLHFDVRITEISRDVTEELGVNWSTSFAGPSLNYEKVWNANSTGQVPATNEAASYLVNSLIGAAVSPVDLILGEQIEGPLTLQQQQRLVKSQNRSYTFWGVGTSIISMINLLESNGAAMTLTKPRLSARSGGMASLVVGGEIPVVTSSVNGQTVTYKDYGILLEVEPTLDQYDNITGRVSIEVSALDLANAVDGQPAFRKRASSNDIRLSPGETLALAGLIERDEQIAYTGLKWLQDIPVLGNLFRNKSFTEGETELVILITPTEIEDLGEGSNKELVDRLDGIMEDFEKYKYDLAQYPKEQPDAGEETGSSEVGESTEATTQLEP